MPSHISIVFVVILALVKVPHVSSVCPYPDTFEMSKDVLPLHDLLEDTENGDISPEAACEQLPDLYDAAIAQVIYLLNHNNSDCEEYVESGPHQQVVEYTETLNNTYCYPEPPEPEGCDLLGRTTYDCLESRPQLLALMPALAQTVNTIEIDFEQGVRDSIQPYFSSLASLCSLNKTSDLAELWECSYPFLSNCTDVDVSSLVYSISLGNLSSQLTLMYDDSQLDAEQANHTCSLLQECNTEEPESILDEMNTCLDGCYDDLHMMYLDQETLNCSLVSMLSEALGENPSSCSLIDDMIEGWVNNNFWFLGLQITCEDETEDGFTPPTINTGESQHLPGPNNLFLLLILLVFTLVLQILWRC